MFQFIIYIYIDGILLNRLFFYIFLLFIYKVNPYIYRKSENVIKLCISISVYK